MTMFVSEKALDANEYYYIVGIKRGHNYEYSSNYKLGDIIIIYCCYSFIIIYIN